MEVHSLYCNAPDNCIGIRVGRRIRYVSVLDAVEIVNMPRWLKKYGWLLNGPDAMQRLTALINGPVNVLDGKSRPPPIC